MRDEQVVLVQRLDRDLARTDLGEPPGDAVGHGDDAKARVGEQPEQGETGAAAAARQRQQYDDEQRPTDEDRLDDQRRQRLQRHAEVAERQPRPLLLGIRAVEEVLAPERLDLLDRAERVLQRLEHLATQLMLAAARASRELSRGAQEADHQERQHRTGDERHHRRGGEQHDENPRAHEHLGADPGDRTEGDEDSVDVVRRVADQLRRIAAEVERVGREQVAVQHLTGERGARLTDDAMPQVLRAGEEQILRDVVDRDQQRELDDHRAAALVRQVPRDPRADRRTGERLRVADHGDESEHRRGRARFDRTGREAEHRNEQPPPPLRRRQHGQALAHDVAHEPRYRVNSSSTHFPRSHMHTVSRGAGSAGLRPWGGVHPPGRRGLPAAPPLPGSLGDGHTEGPARS